MKTIGLTGGIGSGKSSLLPVFIAENIPVFEADKVAKELQEEELKPELIKHFGASLYASGRLDRKALATLVFQDSTKLELLNSLVHPAVAKAFEVFKDHHKEASLVVKEAAILFETGGAATCDYTILITAPKAARIARVHQRDGLDKGAVEARMAQQWPDEKKIPLADFVIQNEDLARAKADLKRVLSALKGDKLSS